MIELDVDPRKVWGFYQEFAGVSISLLDYVRREGFGKIPRVPVFEIPKEIRINGHIWMLADGNTRRNVAEYNDDILPIAKFSPCEKMDEKKHRLSYFMQMNDPRLYNKLLKMYLLKVRGGEIFR